MYVTLKIEWFRSISFHLFYFQLLKLLLNWQQNNEEEKTDKRLNDQHGEMASH